MIPVGDWMRLELLFVSENEPAQTVQCMTHCTPFNKINHGALDLGATDYYYQHERAECPRHSTTVATDNLSRQLLLEQNVDPEGQFVASRPSRELQLWTSNPDFPANKSTRT